MRVCPCCGYSENLLWQQSRFAANHMFMRKEDFATEFPLLWSKLQEYKPIEEGTFVYYLGKKAIYVKRFEVVGGSIASNYEGNVKFGGNMLRINKWVKKQGALKSNKQTKLASLDNQQSSEVKP
jgi:hypothetical protein